MRKRFTVIALVLALVLLADNGAKAVSYLGADSVEDLARIVTYVVRVEVLSGGRVRVLEVFSGEIQPGDMIGVGQTSGFLDRFFRGLPTLPLTRGDDLVLFLTHWDGDSRATLLNPWQGAYRFPNSNESTLTLDAGVELENVLGHDRIRLTIGDLQQLAETNFGDDPHEAVAHSGLRPRSPAVWPLLLILCVITIMAIIIRKRKLQK